MPGPLPKYRPVFRTKDLEEARAVLQEQKSVYAEARRARLAILLSENPGLSNPETGRILGVHENTVRYWRKNWMEEGFRLRDKPRPGRPRFFPPSDHHHHQEHRLRGSREAAATSEPTVRAGRP